LNSLNGSEPSECWADIGDLRVRYLDWGGQGKPAVLLHGLASSANWYDLVSPHLRNHYRSDAVLYRASVYWVNLTGANLSGARLTGANLFGADLEGADLGHAILIKADLTGAYLSGANLDGATLDDVIGADFTGALNVPEKYLKD